MALLIKTVSIFQKKPYTGQIRFSIRSYPSICNKKVFRFHELFWVSPTQPFAQKHCWEKNRNVFLCHISPFWILNKNLSWVSAITFQPAAAVQKRLEIVIQIQTKGLLPPPFYYSLQSATASVSYALGLDWSFQTICKSNCIPRIIYEIIINENLTGWENFYVNASKRECSANLDSLIRNIDGSSGAFDCNVWSTLGIHFGGQLVCVRDFDQEINIASFFRQPSDTECT